MRKKNVLILGVSGQDGSYLAHYLIKKKYNVIGLSRKRRKISNHIKLGIEKKIIIKNFNYNDYDKMKSVIIRNNINQIYFLSGQPKPSLSDKNILETLYSNIIPVYNIIDIISAVNFILKRKVRPESYILKNSRSFSISKIIDTINSFSTKKIKVKWLSNKIIKEKLYNYKQLKQWRPINSNIKDIVEIIKK